MRVKIGFRIHSLLKYYLFRITICFIFEYS